MKYQLLIAVLLSSSAMEIFSSCEPVSIDGAAVSESRSTFVISDLHMGLGYVNADRREWNPTEDFRWPNALKGFLDMISEVGEGRADLVIAGDFLELWQPPDHIRCEGLGADYGCTVEELEEITRIVVDAHRNEFAELAAFAARDDNCVIIIPGNHDAALLIDSVWQLVESNLAADAGCVRRVGSGVWVSSDGWIVVEHGHQISPDPNRYSNWPMIVRRQDGKRYVQRPWGERFVQRVFNEEEKEFPLIDNLSPMSAGVRYRLAGQSRRETAADIAHFLKFNLLETSVRQEAAYLGEQGGDSVSVDVNMGRNLGYKLFLAALPTEDPFAQRLRDCSGNWSELCSELNRMTLDSERISDDEVKTLCEQAIARGRNVCWPTLGGLLVRAVRPGKHIIRSHIAERWRTSPRLQSFVYGHTHSFEKEWSLRLPGDYPATVSNSGAFQRVIDDAGFDEIADSLGVSPGDLLRLQALEQLPPCYTFVQLTNRDGRLSTSLKAWYMEESGPGLVTDPCGNRCARVGHGCR